jgi:uncharacterized membrane protein
MAQDDAEITGPLLNVDRLVFLIDGVFAISLTLLVLDLRLPDENGAPLSQALRALIPRLALYLFAFVTIANQWAIHHRTFRLVRHADYRLVMLSLVNLLFITLIPASAAIVGGHFREPLAAACYSVNGLLLCLSGSLVWAYIAANSHLLAEDADPRYLVGIAQVWLYVAIGFGLALGIGFLNVYAAYAVWVLWSPLVSVWWTRKRKELESLQPGGSPAPSEG